MWKNCKLMYGVKEENEVWESEDIRCYTTKYRYTGCFKNTFTNFGSCFLHLKKVKKIPYKRGRIVSEVSSGTSVTVSFSGSVESFRKLK